VKEGEQVLIVTDTGFEREVVETFAAMASARGAEVVVSFMPPRKIPGAEPPPTVASAMLGANVILELTSMWIGSSQARVKACEAGARYLMMPELYSSLLYRGGPVDVDFERIAPIAEDIRDRFTRAKEVTLRASGGTDLRASLDGRKGRALSGNAKSPGTFSAPPIIEAGAGPIEGTTEGVLVIDGVIPLVGIGQVRSPIRVEIREGKARSFSAAAEDDSFARQLEGLLAGYDDPNVYEVAEIALGLNPRSQMGDSAVDAEAKLGTAHVAFGDNRGYGGTNAAKCHIDCVIRDVSLWLDGEPIMENGKLLVGDIPD
jgi:leucyl aminopeptidase (aminopeptidase T)